MHGSQKNFDFFYQYGKGEQMIIKVITASNEMWNKVKNYADSCSWKAGKSLANAMLNNGFKDWERVIVALNDDEICGYCTVAITDCIPDVHYTPYIGYLFVDEKWRGNRLSQRLIIYSMSYLKSVGFDKVYLVSDHENLYEKYGFDIIDRKMSPWGSEEKIYYQKIQ